MKGWSGFVFQQPGHRAEGIYIRLVCDKPMTPEAVVVDLLMLALPLFIFLAIILSLRRPPPKSEYKNYVRVGRKWMTMDEYRSSCLICLYTARSLSRGWFRMYYPR
jgi:hypothetical protein